MYCNCSLDVPSCDSTYRRFENKNINEYVILSIIQKKKKMLKSLLNLICNKMHPFISH